MEPVRLLAVESSCDETSAAVISGGRILSNVVSSQARLHSEYGGVVPELATREHLRNFLPVTRRALAEAGLSAGDITAVAATQGPGLPSALLVGFQAAQAFAYAVKRPFIGIQHHEAHLYSSWICSSPARLDLSDFEASVCLIVSGGHTLLVHLKAELEHRVLGGTVDDAAGECFDKVGKLLGLPYPGGPEIDRLGERGNAARFVFPRPMINDPADDFSFSGLKTSVRYFLRDHPGLMDEPQATYDLCASVQAAIVDVLVTKTIRAAKRLGVRSVAVSGGVVANRALRGRFEARGEAEGLTVRLAAREFSTDNAAMIGVLAERKLLRGEPKDWMRLDVRPNWSLEEAM